MKRAVPPVPTGANPRHGFDSAVKENIDVLTGQVGGKIKPLADNATLADVIAKVNEILARLQ